MCVRCIGCARTRLDGRWFRLDFDHPVKLEPDPNKLNQIIIKNPYNKSKTLDPHSPLAEPQTPHLQRSFSFPAAASNTGRTSFAVNVALLSCLKTKLCGSPLTLSRRRSHFSPASDSTTPRRLRCHSINLGNFFLFFCSILTHTVDIIVLLQCVNSPCCILTEAKIWFQ